MADLEPECVLAQYRIGALLGRGATGAVYRGVERTGARRTVAIKVVDHGGGAGGTQSARRARLARYLQRMSEVRHSGIVLVHDAICQGSRDYIVMELARGGDLGGCLGPERLLPPARVLGIGAALAEALQHAHARGVVHGDLKPANVLYDPRTGTAKLTDFALACPAGARAPRFLGTPLYMAPERLCGGRIVPESDQFSLAVLVYRLLSGELPFAGRTRPEVVWNMAHGAPRPLPVERARGYRTIAGILRTALASCPAERYTSMAEMALALHAARGRLPRAAEAAVMGSAGSAPSVAGVAYAGTAQAARGRAAVPARSGLVS